MELEHSQEESADIGLGRNARRIREIIGMSQRTLADKTGYTQQYISKLEKKGCFTSYVLKKVARALGVNPGFIVHFDEKRVINLLLDLNREYDERPAPAHSYKYKNSSDIALSSTVEENKVLYEALLKSERDKVSLLEKMLDEKGEKNRQEGAAGISKAQS